MPRLKCAGMSYVMEYAKEVNPNDELIEDKAYEILYSRKFDEELENTLRTMRAEAFVEFKELD